MTDLVGMIHLAALPGSPRSSLSIGQCLDLARRDAEALQEGGVDAVVVENFNDVPFRPGPVDPYTVAAMTWICGKLREELDVRLGVNVLRNDALAALGIAAATGAEFIRVNIHTGAMLTDQGMITGTADETLRARRALGAEHVRIFADVLVKHAVAPGPVQLRDAVADAIERGMADAVIVTGSGTGKDASPEDVQVAADVAGSTPVYVGSGVSASTVSKFVPPAQGLIVGSWLKIDGDVKNPVDVNRVRQLKASLLSDQ